MINSLWKWGKYLMAYVTKHKDIEIRSQEKEVVIKLEITLNVNMETGHVSLGASPISSPLQQKSPQEMKVPEFVIPKFDMTTELIEGFGEDK